MAERTPITQPEMDKFLDHIEQGLSRPEAARKVGRTGAQFRALSRRDPGFDNAYQEACDIGRETLGAGIRAEYHRRALDPESRSDTLLHNLAVVHCDEFSSFRRQRVEMTGADGGPIQTEDVDGAAERLRAKLAPVVDIAAKGGGTNGHRNGNTAA